MDPMQDRDEEIRNVALKDSLYQPSHARLAVVGFEFRGKDDNASEGDQVCEDVEFMGICETTSDRYQQTRPGTLGMDRGTLSICTAKRRGRMQTTNTGCVCYL